MPKIVTTRQEVLEKLIAAISNQLADGFSAADIMPIIAAAVEAAEVLQISGADKKVLVVEAIETVANKFIDDPAIRAVVIALTPSAIDTAVSLAKSDFMRRRSWLLCCA